MMTVTKTIKVHNRMIVLHGICDTIDFNDIKGMQYGTIVKIGAAICRLDCDTFNEDLGIRIAKGRCKKKPIFTLASEHSGEFKSQKVFILNDIMAIVSNEISNNPKALKGIVNLKHPRYDRNRKNSIKREDKTLRRTNRTIRTDNVS